MPTPRHQQISIETTPLLHLTSRCVRRAFLCGVDEETGINYEHRRQWIIDRIDAVASAFAIEVDAYAVMVNHYHLVVRVRPELASTWTESEVARRWRLLFTGTQLPRGYIDNPQGLTPQELALARQTIEKWRRRLADPSWVMRAINEPIARRANAEDECAGHFWESRFKCQSLLDEQAHLACMAYVDLNPVRACSADSPETSDYTSIQRRINAVAQGRLPTTLSRFKGDLNKYKPDSGIPFDLKEYVQLIDWTGRVISSDKRGTIASSLPPILQRLKIDTDAWLAISTNFEQHTARWVGPRAAINRAATRVGMTRCRSPALSLSG